MILPTCEENRSLCSRWFFFIKSDLPGLLLLPCPCWSALAEHWLLIFPASWGAGPSLTPFPQADPISHRSQATAHSHVRHSNNWWHVVNIRAWWVLELEISLFDLCHVYCVVVGGWKQSGIARASSSSFRLQHGTRADGYLCLCHSWV
jgi:hypothetical protein